MNEIKKVYVSGKMSGLPDKNYPLFRAVAKEFREKGYEVIDPSENFQGDDSLEWHRYMKLDVAHVASVDALIMLPGWETSQGAQIEVALAERLKVPIFTLESVREFGFTNPIMPIVEIKAYMQPKGQPTGAIKYNTGKLRYSLLPNKPIAEVVRVLMFGAEKYGDWNWEQGFFWSTLYEAARRHLIDGWWENGEDLDQESFLPHLAHCICNLIFLMVFAVTHPELDDRPKKRLKPIDSQS